MKITILTNYNLYESKRYFAQKFAEALKRHGIEVAILDNSELLEDQEKSRYLIETDLTCSFNSILPLKNGEFFWSLTHIPHWAILVDPSFYYSYLFKEQYVFVSCVDKFDCEYARSYNFKKVFFWPHAVEKDLTFDESIVRPYDVVFIGSCYDHEELRRRWQQELPPVLSQVIDDAVDIVLSDNKTSLIPAITLALSNKKIKVTQGDFEVLVYYVDNYMRGKDRYELIRSIKEAHVHVFGDTCWRREQPVYGWERNLEGMSNVSVHPAVSFEASLQILKQSKICLNSMPFFKNGTHERIFTGLACGSLPITTDNIWVSENFEDKKELILYQSKHWDKVNDKVNDLLADENKRREIVNRGRLKVMREHTWDVRVDQMLKELPLVLKHI